MARASWGWGGGGGVNNMHALSWGGGGAQTEKMLKLKCTLMTVQTVILGCDILRRSKKLNYFTGNLKLPSAIAK